MAQHPFACVRMYTELTFFTTIRGIRYEDAGRKMRDYILLFLLYNVTVTREEMSKYSKPVSD